MSYSEADDEAIAAVGRKMAQLETDCSKSWPECPRETLLCDCRLRAVNAVNTLRLMGKLLS